jgi:hypothetical protein
MIRSVIAAIKNSYKPLCKHESDNQYKPDTDVVKAAKKACTSYLNLCASAKQTDA